MSNKRPACGSFVLAGEALTLVGALLFFNLKYEKIIVIENIGAYWWLTEALTLGHLAYGVSSLSAANEHQREVSPRAGFFIFKI